MQIIIPMSGFGERFRRAGYGVPKPLIEIEGKPIIAHVIDMFPGEKKFIFICNNDHLNDDRFNMEGILKKYCPTGKIIGIPAHKSGPVYAIMQVKEHIDLSEPSIVNYCDFTCYWDWADFSDFVIKNKCDGSIPAYKGFHPHTLGTTNYAYMLEKEGWVKDIQEKQPYTDNRMEEYASSGTYYFATGELMLNAMQKTMEENLNINGEYYVSLSYKPLLKDGKSISIYPLQHFMQWGTPDDVAEYNMWSNTFKSLANPQHQANYTQGTIVIPMAGLGQRFVNEGYTLAKPLIPVSGVPMVMQAVDDLPNAHHHVFVLREDMEGHDAIVRTIKHAYPNALTVAIPKVTEGQACSAQLGIDALENIFGIVEEPVTFGACDYGAIYNHQKFQALLKDENVDVIVWGVRGYTNALRQPQMYGWIDADKQNKISEISVKKPLSTPEKDPIVLGSFTFKKINEFRSSLSSLIKRDGRVNGEFYLDSCINDAIQMGLNCYLFEVDHLLSWGTPNDLRTFEYWQSCFSKWDTHPYTLEKDSSIPEKEQEGLRKKYQKIIPKRMEVKI